MKCPISLPTASLTGGMVALAVLLLISVAINLVSAACWIYRLRVRGGKIKEENPRNQEQIYEEVKSDKPLHVLRDEVFVKKNEAYGRISARNPLAIPNTTI